MRGFFSDFFRGGIASITDDSLRDKMLIELDLMDRRLERAEKDLAKSEVKREHLEKEIADLKAKIPPDNMIDIGPCFIVKLADGSMSKSPYCPKCRTVMAEGALGQGSFHCRCGLWVTGAQYGEAILAYNNRNLEPA